MHDSIMQSVAGCPPITAPARSGCKVVLNGREYDTTG